MFNPSSIQTSKAFAVFDIKILEASVNYYDNGYSISPHVYPGTLALPEVFIM